MSSEPDAPKSRKALSTMVLARRAVTLHAQQLAEMVEKRMRVRAVEEQLTLFARRWHYSWSNNYLIEQQCPGAGVVRSKTDWPIFGRRVKPGATPIQIVARNRFEKGGYPFVEVSVFDESQTEEMPEEERRKVAAPKPRMTVAEASQRMRGALELLQVPLRIVELSDWKHPGCMGISHRGGIEIQAGLAPEEHLRVMVHECAHYLLHSNPRRDVGRSARPGTGFGLTDLLTRVHPLKEAEAEGTAFIVLTVLGFAPPSAEYIAEVGADGKDVLLGQRRLSKAAKIILEAVLDGRLVKDKLPERKTLGQKTRMKKHPTLMNFRRGRKKKRK